MMELKLELVARIPDMIPDNAAKNWLTGKLQSIQPGSPFHLAFGMAPRKVGKDIITLPEDVTEMLGQINPDIEKVSWTLDEWCRLLLLLHLPESDLQSTIAPLVAAADSREQRLIFKAIQYLANPAPFEMMMVDGIRTNMIDVYDSIALHNSFPKKYFKEGAWNQMVLKGIFMERPIFRILGLEERRNPDLARIAVDFAHERWSAGRKVTPELWRLVIHYMDASTAKELIQAYEKADALEQQAIAKALQESNIPEAQAWLAETGAAANTRGWESIGQEIFEKTK